jgi:hypothetical protein
MIRLEKIAGEFYFINFSCQLGIYCALIVFSFSFSLGENIEYGPKLYQARQRLVDKVQLYEVIYFRNTYSTGRACMTFILEM